MKKKEQTKPVDLPRDGEISEQKLKDLNNQIDKLHNSILQYYYHYAVFNLVLVLLVVSKVLPTTWSDYILSCVSMWSFIALVNLCYAHLRNWVHFELMMLSPIRVIKSFLWFVFWVAMMAGAIYLKFYF